MEKEYKNLEFRIHLNKAVVSCSRLEHVTMCPLGLHYLLYKWSISPFLQLAAKALSTWQTLEAKFA
jgi:hypothetical protein